MWNNWNFIANLRASSQTALALALLLSVFGILSGLTDFWTPGGYRILPSGSYALVPAFIAIVFAFFFQRKTQTGLSNARSSSFVVAGAWILVILFFSDWLCRSYNFYQGPSIRGEILLLSLCTYFLLKHNLFSSRLAIAVFAASLLLSIYCFFVESNGQVIFSDDHSVFMYRLQSLVKAFPYVPFYNPEWNAGHDARDSLATGALSLFFLGLPWLYLFPVEKIYNFLVVWIVLIQFPLGGFWACRLAGFNGRAAAFTGIVSLACSLHWYRWALKYGTMGFVCSSTLLCLVIVLASLLVSRSESSKRLVLLFVLITTLSLLWPFYGVILVPLFAYLLLIFLKDIYAKNANNTWRIKRMIWVGALLLLLNLPWMTVFVGSSGLLGFLNLNKSSSAAIVQTEQSQRTDTLPISEEVSPELEESPKNARRFRHAQGKLSADLSLKMLRKLNFSANPLLIFMGLLGVFVLRGHLRNIYILQLSWLFLLGVVFFPLKPQLELDRLVLLFLILLALPAGLAIDRLFDLANTQRTLLQRLPVALVGGFLLTGPLLVFGVLKNRSTEHYSFSSPIVTNMTSLLKDYKPQGRIMFAGCVIHEFGNGHLAPLAGNSGHPLLASSPAHNLWWYKDLMPNEFLVRGDQGREDFMRLYNVSDVFAHESKWKKYFRQRPEKYQLIWSGHNFELYHLRYFDSNYFFQGQGELLSQAVNSVKLRVDSDTAVIKFRYTPALQATTCKIEPYKVGQDLEFIKLSNCDGQEVELKALAPWQQLFLANRKAFY